MFFDSSGVNIGLSSVFLRWSCRSLLNAILLFSYTNKTIFFSFKIYCRLKFANFICPSSITADIGDILSAL